jgi:hypothetical protein
MAMGLCYTQLVWTLISKAMVNSQNSRGTTYSLYQVTGTIGVMIYDKIGGDLSAKSDTAPFVITWVGFTALVLLVVILGYCTKSLKY